MYTHSALYKRTLRGQVWVLLLSIVTEFLSGILLVAEPSFNLGQIIRKASNVTAYCMSAATPSGISYIIAIDN